MNVACTVDQILDSVTNTCITDTDPPRITVTSTNIILQIGDTFTPPTVTLTDNDPAYDGTITNSTSPGVVDTSSLGTFTITYNAPADTANNAPIPVDVTVEIIDTTAPIIAINGSSANRIIITPVGEPYTVPAGNVTDNDPAYIESVTITPTLIDTANPGVFPIRYTAPADASGNTPLPVVITIIVPCPDGQVFDGTMCITLEFDRVLSFESSGVLQFSNPQAITITDTNIFIVDRGNNRVQVSDHNGNYISTIGSQGSGNGEFNRPQGIATNDTHLFVADTNNHRIQIFNVDGTFVHSFGSSGGADGQFSSPRGITTNDTHIFVADFGNHRVQIFDNAGNFVGKFGSEGTADGEFDYPLGITANNTHVFVLDRDNNRIQIFDDMGNYAGQFGGTGSGDGQFTSPRAIALSNTFIFATDANNNNIQVFDHSGYYISQFGGHTFENNPPADIEFDSAEGLATNDTHLFVADTGNSRIQIFEFATLMPCANDQVHNASGICVSDTIPPVITAEPSSITVLQNAVYSLPPPIVTDNNPSFGGSFVSSHTIDPLDTSSVGAFTITYTAIDAASNIGTATQSIDIVAQCAANQILDSTGALCITDIILPLITVNGSSENRTISVTIGANYTVPAGNVTDNDVNYAESVRISPDTISTTMPETFTISYTAPADAAGNTPVSIVLTVNVACPTGQIFDGNSCIAILEYVSSFGSLGDGDDQFNNPHGIITNSTNIFVSDFSNNRVLVYDHNGNYVSTIGSSGQGDGQFSNPVGITTNNVHLFVVDFNAHRIQIFDMDGEFVKSFGSQGSDDGEFRKPQRITTNDTHLFVADTNNNRIQIFDFNGNYVKQFGSLSPSSGNGQFNSPQGVIATRTHLFVADTNNNRVQIFDHNGNFVNKFGSSGSDNGEFSGPRAITSTDSYIFVADTGNNRVQIFDHDGNFVSKFGSQGSGNGQFSNPVAITTNDTHVLVADIGNHRVQIFQIATLMSCTDIQVRDGTGACVDDTISPDITIIGPSLVTVLQNAVYSLPLPTATDNHPSFDRIVTASRTIDPLDTSSVGSFTITCILATDPAGNIGTATQDINIIAQCATGQILDSATNTCVTDTAPTITVDGSSEDRFVTVLVGASYTVPTGTVIDDDDPAYSETVTTNLALINTSAAGIFPIRYTAPDDAAGNSPNPVVLTVIVSCPDSQSFIENTCIAILEPVSSLDSDLFGPHGVATSSKRIFVSDTQNNRIQIFDTDGTFVKQFGSFGSFDGQFNNPVGITTNNTHLFVVDQNNIRVQIFDHNGEYASQFEGNFGGFDLPYAITTNTTNDIHIFVSDSNNHRVQLFDTSGEYAAQLGSLGTGNGQFNNPAGIVVNDTRLFAVDKDNNRIQIVDFNGNYVDQFGSTGTENGNFSSPTGITTNKTHLFITDTDNHRIQIFDTNGNYISQFGSFGTASGKFDSPTGITTNSTHLFVADTGNHRIQIFQFASIVPCTDTQIRDNTGCITDTTPPLIKVNPTTIQLQLGATFTPPTVSIADNDPSYSGTVSFTTSPGPVDTSSVGIFTIRYTAPADAAGNSPNTVTVTVTVAETSCDANQVLNPDTNFCEIDTSAPVITITGPSPVTILQNSTYAVPPPTITDNDPNYDGSFTASRTIDPLDTSSEGTFPITYTATDPAGNVGSAQQIIIVVTQCLASQILSSDGVVCMPDTILPVIIIDRSSENRTITIIQNSSYSLPNGTVTDNDPAYIEIVTHTPRTIDNTIIISTNIVYTAPADAAGNIPETIVITANVATECPLGQVENSVGLCLFSSGGSSSDWKTKPTFGLSWENNQPFVHRGFTLNDYTLDITNNWHTDFVPVNGVIGKENNAQIKVYAPKELTTVILSLSVPEVGKVNDAETNILIAIQPNYTGTFEPIITKITHEQKESLVDENKTTATLSKSLCNNLETIEKCYTVDINFVVLAPLKSDPLAITAIDTKHRYTTTYINEGLTFTGNSMLEPATAQLVIKKGNQYGAETIELVQQDRRHNLWEDQHGELWTQNDHDTWIQLTFTIETPTDSYVNVMTRMHTEFDSRVVEHTQNMELMRDSIFEDVYTDIDDNP